MAVIYQTKAEKWKNFFARYSKFTKAAAILVLAFFVVCACTIGGFNSPGKAYYAQADSDIVFYLDYDGEKQNNLGQLGAVYVNIGAVYESVGTDFKLNFRRSSVSSSSWLSSNMGNVELGNIYSTAEGGVSGANYNWVKIFDYTAGSTTISTSYRIVRLTVPGDMLINEVVFVDRGGDVIHAVVNASEARTLIGESNWNTVKGGDKTTGDYFRQNDRSASLGKWGDPSRLVDAQDNYTTGSSYYTNFTQDEMYTLMQIDNILLGSHLPEGTFNADTDNGPLAALFPLLGTPSCLRRRPLRSCISSRGGCSARRDSRSLRRRCLPAAVWLLPSADSDFRWLLPHFSSSRPIILCSSSLQTVSLRRTRQRVRAAVSWRPASFLRSLLQRIRKRSLPPSACWCCLCSAR